VEVEVPKFVLMKKLSLEESRWSIRMVVGLLLTLLSGPAHVVGSERR
jgi:hypothetical protein